MVDLDSGATAATYLSNGLIGLRQDPQGFGGEGALFDSRAYEPSGEEKILRLADPLPLSIEIAGEPLRMVKPVTYRREVDFRTGVASVRWQHGIGGTQVICEIKTALDPAKREIGQTLILKAKDTVEATIRFPGPSEAQVFLPNSQVSSQPETWFVLKGLPYLCKVRYSLEANRRGPLLPSPVPRWTGRVGSEGIRISRAVRMTDVRAQPGPFAQSMRLEGEDTEQRERPAEAAFSAAAAHWQKAWETDIEIDGPVEDQQAIRSFLFYLRSSIHPDGAMSVAPMGLSSQTYNGHIFWDADIWVFPALALIDPARAQSIVNYRERHSIEAMRNASRTFPDLKGPVYIHQYPWESSVSGREVAPPSHRREFHITGSVAWSQAQAAALGLVDPTSASLSVAGAANFYGRMAVKNAAGQLELRDVMSPDENHVGNNDLYTNLLAQWCMNNGSWKRRVGSTAPTFKLPRDDRSFLTYDNDSLRGYKQAAAVLAIYPLQYPEAEKQARTMMERFAEKTSKNGPAMSDSVHALIWARLGEAEKAHRIWRKSWQDFTKRPLLLFSEKRSKDVTYFATGAGGCLQTVLYGFLGIRIGEEAQPNSRWSTPLAGGQVLSIKPSLPPAWRSVKLKNFTVCGKRYDLEATHASLTVRPRDESPD